MNDIQYEIEGVGPAVYEITQPVLNMQVEKSGERTEHTLGYVSMVNYNSGRYGSTNDFEVLPDVAGTRFAYYGDSGSLIVERTNPSGAEWKRVIGLLWGGDPGGDPPIGNAYAHVMEDVFVDLDLTTVCAGIVESIIEDIFSYSHEGFSEEYRMPQPVEIEERRPRREWFPGRRFYRKIARDFEKQLVNYKRGRVISELFYENRVQLINMFTNRDVRRALYASVTPFVKGAWTTSEILRKVVTDNDADRFERFLNIVEEQQPNMKKEMNFAKELLEKARGNRVIEILE
jgi:hypothetical protein